MFTPKELALERGWPGRIEGDRVIQLAAQTLQSFFTGGGHAREHAEFALADVELRAPDGTSELDYELEVAAVIGAGGAIAGFTVMNDWSARDLQRMEMRVGLGPAKGKDFATSLGPVVVTPDQFDGTSGLMTARVNGEQRSPRPPRATPSGGPATPSAPAPSERAASSSTATAAGCSPATSSSSRSR